MAAGQLDRVVEESIAAQAAGVAIKVVTVFEDLSCNLYYAYHYLDNVTKMVTVTIFEYIYTHTWRVHVLRKMQLTFGTRIVERAIFSYNS